MTTPLQKTHYKGYTELQPVKWKKEPVDFDWRYDPYYYTDPYKVTKAELMKQQPETSTPISATIRIDNLSIAGKGREWAKNYARIEIARKIVAYLVEHDLLNIRIEEDFHTDETIFIGKIYLGTNTTKILKHTPEDFLKVEEAARKSGHKEGYSQGFREGAASLLEGLMECWETDKNIDAFLKEFKEILKNQDAEPI